MTCNPRESQRRGPCVWRVLLLRSHHSLSQSCSKCVRSAARVSAPTQGRGGHRCTERKHRAPEFAEHSDLGALPPLHRPSPCALYFMWKLHGHVVKPVSEVSRLRVVPVPRDKAAAYSAARGDSARRRRTRALSPRRQHSRMQIAGSG
ncbi:unnamed protein product [Chrysodeixis includens]|uniref:Uncharacterized protein n=1 Tax=Chrysodeixis includens TaxID=689277 RepID=A0A9N8KVA6_CHRIL|nr:unnamed protein product [Chrysodeixis includens]